jgi:hypothetical protein
VLAHALELLVELKVRIVLLLEEVPPHQRRAGVDRRVDGLDGLDERLHRRRGWLRALGDALLDLIFSPFGFLGLPCPRSRLLLGAPQLLLALGMQPLGLSDPGIRLGEPPFVVGGGGALLLLAALGLHVPPADALELLGVQAAGVVEGVLCAGEDGGVLQLGVLEGGAVLTLEVGGGLVELGAEDAVGVDDVVGDLVDEPLLGHAGRMADWRECTRNCFRAVLVVGSGKLCWPDWD